MAVAAAAYNLNGYCLCINALPFASRNKQGRLGIVADHNLHKFEDLRVKGEVSDAVASPPTKRYVVLLMGDFPGACIAGQVEAVEDPEETVNGAACVTLQPLALFINAGLAYE